jgi:uncharacterized membrane protein YkvA (DUF1232 family)
LSLLFQGSVVYALTGAKITYNIGMSHAHKKGQTTPIMPEKPKHSGLPAPPDSLFARLGEQFRLSWRLFQDNRVPLRVKLIPILGLAYIVSPFGLIPELIPVIGQIDAIAVVLLIVAWFNYAAPRVLVDEHLLYLRSRAKPIRRAMRDNGGIIIENRIHFADEPVESASDVTSEPTDEDIAVDLDPDHVTGNTEPAENEATDDQTEPEPDEKLFTKQAQAKR